MPAGLQLLNFFKQSLTGGALEALAPGTGDSATFQNVPQGTGAYLADVRGVDDASPCEFSLTASRFHDQLLGIAGWVPSGATLAPPNRPVSISPPGFDQPIYPSDVLEVRALGQANDNVNVSMLVYYPELPGINAQLRTVDAVRAAMVNLVGVDVQVDASAGTQGDWSPTVALSAAGRRLDAGKYYAVLGFTGGEPLAGIAIQGFETGNLRIGGPLLADGDHDANLFADLAEKYNTALVPVIQGSNQDSILVSCFDPAAGQVDTTVLLAELVRPI